MAGRAGDGAIRVQGLLGLSDHILLLGGINLLVLGILGQYLGKTYMEVKARPLYVVRETSDAEEPAKSGPRDSGEPKQPKQGPEKA